MTTNHHETNDDGSAYGRLVAAISDGTYRPRDRLREVEVAARLGLSRTPVREALRRLEADGLVVHTPRFGAVVRQLSHGEIVELYETRVVIERTAAAMAARHANPAEVEEMERLNGEIAQLLDTPGRAAAINQSFHRALFLAARNRFLMEAARALNNALLLLGPTTLADAERISVVVEQHGDIIQAIRSGDEDAAGRAAEEHLQTSLRHRLQVLNS